MDRTLGEPLGTTPDRVIPASVQRPQPGNYQIIKEPFPLVGIIDMFLCLN